jgi:hypothetical protein
MAAVVTVGRRPQNGEVPPPAAPEVPAHATDEARAERARRLAAQAEALRAADEEASPQQADPFADLDGPKKGPRDVLRAAPSAAPAEPVEDIESVEIELPNGRVVVYGPTRGKSHALALSRIFRGPAALAPLGQQVVDQLFNIRSIDGQEVEWPKTIGEAQAIMDLIDDDGWEHLSLAQRLYWPNVTEDRLKVLKKNMRLG